MAGSNEREEAVFRYRVLTEGPTAHHVVVVHDDTPNWFRLIATFHDKDRAEHLAEFENDIATDMLDEPMHKADIVPAPVERLPAEPRTNVSVSTVETVLLERRTTDERLTVTRESPVERLLVEVERPIGPAEANDDPDTKLRAMLLDGIFVEDVAAVLGVSVDRVQARHDQLVVAGELSGKAPKTRVGGYTHGMRAEDKPKRVNMVRPPAGTADHEARQAEIMGIILDLRHAGVATKFAQITSRLSFPKGSFYAEVNALIEAGKLVKIMSWFLPFGAEEPALLVAEREAEATVPSSAAEANLQVPLQDPPLQAVQPPERRTPSPPWDRLVGPARPQAVAVSPVDGADLPRPKTDEELIEEHLRTKGLVRLDSDTMVTLDMMLDEVRASGRKVIASDSRKSFTVTGKEPGVRKLHREELFTLANKIRLANGRPLWDSRRLQLYDKEAVKA